MSERERERGSQGRRWSPQRERALSPFTEVLGLAGHGVGHLRVLLVANHLEDGSSRVTQLKGVHMHVC